MGATSSSTPETSSILIPQGRGPERKRFARPSPGSSNAAILAEYPSANFRNSWRHCDYGAKNNIAFAVVGGLRTPVLRTAVDVGHVWEFVGPVEWEGRTAVPPYRSGFLRDHAERDQ